MDFLYDIKDLLCDRLCEVAEESVKRERIPDNQIELVDYLTHSLKSVVTTIAMCEGGYSEDGGYSGRRSYDGNSGTSMDGGSYGNGYSERRGRSRMTGRFVSRDGGYSGRGRYSRDGGGQDVVKKIEQIMRDTPDNNTKKRLSELKEQMSGGEQ